MSRHLAGIIVLRFGDRSKQRRLVENLMGRRGGCFVVCVREHHHGGTFQRRISDTVYDAGRTWANSGQHDARDTR